MDTGRDRPARESDDERGRRKDSDHPRSKRLRADIGASKDDDSRYTNRNPIRRGPNGLIHATERGKLKAQE
ncbi:hypothetical protein PTNB73_01361 [Pyrenophora teres f. teres]|nr:hypothetical protein PTNB85_00044 [Pyrenophora teres f. teres]KAE8852345.1 hypothetical protein HRS9122_02632 [Pyrenophora teres f. teres]KAE8874729.1 hypothetical protein PTNB73_01361 [Pyrenophora teres f. teres]